MKVSCFSSSMGVQHCHNFTPTIIVPPQYIQKYRAEWEKVPIFRGWLQPCTSDNTKAFCKYCTSILAAKPCDFQKHAENKKHKIAPQPFSVNSNQQRINFKPVGKVTVKQQKEAQLWLYSAVHTSIRTIDHLSDIHHDFKCDPGETISIHRTKSTSLIQNHIQVFLLKIHVENTILVKQKKHC